jgi:hypothetical protein
LVIALFDFLMWIIETFHSDNQLGLSACLWYEWLYLSNQKMG